MRPIDDIFEFPERIAFWIERTDPYMDTTYECSHCREPFSNMDGSSEETMFKYCPECGYKMTSIYREEDEDETLFEDS